MAKHKKKQKQLMTWKTSMKKFLKQLDSLRPIIKGLARGTSEFIVEGTDNSIDNAIVAGLDDLLDEMPSITDVIIPFVDSVTESGQMQVLNTIRALWDQSGISHQISNKSFNKTVLSTFKDRMENILRTDSNFFDKMYSYSHKAPKFIEQADKSVKEVADKIIKGGQEIMNKIKEKAPIKPKSKPSGGGRSRGRQHPQWYLRNPYNLHTNVNLNNNKAMLLNVKEIIDSKNGYFSVPGTIIYGTQTMEPLDPNNGFRKAVEQLYSTLNITQLGSISYNVEDLSYYLQFATHCWTEFFEMTRSIRLGSTYLAYDATLQTVFSDYKFADDELAAVTNMVINFGNWIYTALPMQGTILDRRELLYSNVFRDSESLNSQYFMFKNKSSVMRKQDEFHILPHLDILTLQHVERVINSIKSEYTDNPNFAIISGHLIRLFGDAVNNSKYLDKLIANRNPAYIKISPLEFIYDKDIIDQVRNATIDDTYGNFYQGSYTANYGTDVDKVRAQAMNTDVMLGVTHLNELVPGKAESLYRFRQHVKDIKLEDDEYIVYVDACGTEHIVDATLYYQASPDVSTLELGKKDILPTYNTSVAGVLPYTPIAAVAFEAFPLVLCVDSTEDGVRVFGILASYNNTILLQDYTYIQAISNGNNSLWYSDMQYRAQNNLISFIK